MAQAMAPAETRPYPKLTPEQKARIFADLEMEFRLGNLRPQQKGGDAGA